MLLLSKGQSHLNLRSRKWLPLMQTDHKGSDHDCVSAANKYYSSAGHNEQKNKKITNQIEFLAVTIKQ